MQDIEVVAIQGLDSAIIGTAIRDGQEVLAYDFEKTVEILLDRGSSMEEAEEYVTDLAQRQFVGAPVFIYVDNDQDSYGFSTEDERTVH
jgi:dihydroxyacetone kinase DhaKLM complex PTS-EIIA-like component DhaM